MTNVKPALSLSWTPSVAPFGLHAAAARARGVRLNNSVVRCGYAQSKAACPLSRQSAVLKVQLRTNRAQPARLVRVQASSSVEGTVSKEAYGIRRIAWISFWAQLSLAVVSAIVVFFTMSTSNWGSVPPVSVLFTLFGVATSFISTFLSFGIVRTARKVIQDNATVQKESITSTLLANQALNLWGIGSALIGLQATVGTLVAKVLTSSTSNPYAAAGQAARANTPTALDAFSVQACTNTIFAHFVSIVFANWLQKILLNPPKASRAMAKPQEPDYTQRRFS